MARNTFRKHEHLCGKLRIRDVALTGAAVHVPPFKLVGKTMDLPTHAPAQIAFAVPRRNLKRAVDRNRIKRLMREAYRTNKNELYAKLEGREHKIAWLVVYQGRADIDLRSTEQKITKALHRWLEQHG